MSKCNEKKKRIASTKKKKKINDKKKHEKKKTIANIITAKLSKIFRTVTNYYPQKSDILHVRKNYFVRLCISGLLFKKIFSKLILAFTLYLMKLTGFLSNIFVFSLVEEIQKRWGGEKRN